MSKNTIVIMQGENGGFKAALSTGESVRVILAEEDIIGGANMEINGIACIGYEVHTAQDPKAVEEALKDFY